MKVLGICIGASTISTAQLTVTDRAGGADPDKGPEARVVAHSKHPHDGDPRRTLAAVLDSLPMEGFDAVAATGRRFRNYVNLSQISEPEAVERAYRFTKPKGISSPAIVSAGGETFMSYVLNRRGEIANVLTGNKCASGTGEFFLQQLRRLDVDITDVAELAELEHPYRLSGRCSVFCKSDCTHATNKGLPVSRVIAGLCRMMAGKILELLKNVEKNNIMVVGGTVKNPVMLHFLEQEIDGLIVPEAAPYFEALGAALWASEHKTLPFPGTNRLFRPDAVSFDTLPPLADFEDRVTFKEIGTDTVRPGDVCLLGLDVGSTTTKAVLMRKGDHAMLASVYLKTNGQPVEASRRCYRRIHEQVSARVDPDRISIIGLGVCGSGRQIAGLHALTDGIINEIIAHAAASVFFDARVDTIFEIGGQDAKYTYITNGVPSDYAMNEACSAGTGSFLEESALETLGIGMTEIADIAVRGRRPPNFNDQCAAFISSDIKTAIHDGVSQTDITAGLVYSICMNYANRVKGNRPVGQRVFMQGGVCYNRAVPLAMASIIGKPIVVPPEPGLMGAFGVALEVEHRLDAGLMDPRRFDLGVLMDRSVTYGRSFVCKGGKEKCDRRCEIAVIELEGTKYPFGGACNRYYNLRRKIRHDIRTLDLVQVRQEMTFSTDAAHGVAGPKGRVGMNRSFLVNTYFPLYSTFFSELGFETVLPDLPTQEGIDQKDAPFCYPAELAHGFFHHLIHEKGPLDYIFLPHFKAVPTQREKTNAQVCPIVQGETFYLRTAFAERLRELEDTGTRVLSPLLDLTRGLSEAFEPLRSAARTMGASHGEAKAAFKTAVDRQTAYLNALRELGRTTLADLERRPEQSAVVIFGRPYNGFVEEAHMGIPRKLASRGIPVIPMDFLPLEEEPTPPTMYWGMGQLILKAAAFVQRHPQLFGLYITNFSCGPDSFIISYFRNLMGRKPALTLELDSHTADAGLETRIEAFLDVISAFRKQVAGNPPSPGPVRFSPARTVINNGRLKVVTSGGEPLPMDDPRVRFLIPSMGRFSSEALAAAFRASGVRATALPPADESALKTGRANTSCKECLPLQLTTGSLLNYIQDRKSEDQVLVYFMATASGPCRFGQYYTFIEQLLAHRRIPDVAMFTLSGENAYTGLDDSFERRAWWAVIISDTVEDIRSMLLTVAEDPEAALGVLEEEWSDILGSIAADKYETLEAQLERSAARLAGIPRKQPPEETPVICLTGEIFVRRDALSRGRLTEMLAEKGFATTCSPVAEWVLFCEYLFERGKCGRRMTLMERFGGFLRRRYMARTERRIKAILSRSGLVKAIPVDILEIVENAGPNVTSDLTCETILTVGASLTEIVTHVCGVIAIGPFGCMPNRLAEAILAKTMVRDRKLSTDPGNQRLRASLIHYEDLPFLAVESDGSPFPQLINAKLETFCLRAERLHRDIMATKNN